MWTTYEIIDRWGYPYQAGGMVYDAEFMRFVFNSINPQSPNQLETQMMSAKHAWTRPKVKAGTWPSVMNLSIN